jgi:multicomponent Na+:H+ antiporter subunit D
VYRLRDTYDLSKLGGLYAAHGAIAVLFLISALSLAGVPPLTGFFAKLALVRAGLDAGQYAIVAVALAVGVLTLFSMVKIWAEAFWKDAPARAQSEDAGMPRDQHPMTVALIAPVVALALLAIVLGIGAGPVFDLLDRAAAQLIDPHEYMEAALK